jgi:hypothetical protein
VKNRGRQKWWCEDSRREWMNMGRKNDWRRKQWIIAQEKERK